MVSEIASVAENGLGGIDFAVMGGYLLLVFLLGAAFAREQRSTKDFFLAGRTMGWIPVGISLMATIFSAISFISVPSVVATFGLVIFAGSWVSLLLIPIVTRVFIPFFCKLNVYSGYEYLEHRFDVRVRCMASGMFIVWRICWMALALYVPCLALQAAMGSENMALLYTMIVVLGVLATVYTVLGGMKAVIWTDVVQFCVLFGGVVVAIVYISGRVHGGVAGVWAFARQQGHLDVMMSSTVRPEFGSLFQWAKWYFTLPISLVAVMVGTFISQLGFFSVDQVMLQRYFSAKSEREAKRSFIMNVIGLFVLGFLLTMLGMHLFAFYQGEVPGELAARGGGWDRVLPYFASHEIWAGVAGVIIAALFAATMSSVDSGINSVSTAVLVDFYQRLCKKQKYPWQSENDLEQSKRQLVLARWLTVFFGLVATVLACFVREIGDNVIDITNKIVNNFSGPMVGIFLLGIFTRKASSWGVLIAPIVGVFSAFVMTVPMRSLFGTSWEIGVSGWWASAIGLIITLTLGYLISLLSNYYGGKTPPENLKGTTWVLRHEDIAAE